MNNERNRQADCPLMPVIDTVTRVNTIVDRMITEFLTTNVPNMQDLSHNVHERISASMGSRCLVYRRINPTFEVNTMYKDRHTTS